MALTLPETYQTAEVFETKSDVLAHLGMQLRWIAKNTGDEHMRNEIMAAADLADAGASQDLPA